jgi:hypothetical protein
VTLTFPLAINHELGELGAVAPAFERCDYGSAGLSHAEQ